MVSYFWNKQKWLEKVFKHLIENMKKDEELAFILQDIVKAFKEEKYEISLASLDKAGKLIVKELNKYNSRH